MEIDEIRQLLDELASFMKQNDLSELEIDIKGAKVNLKKTSTQIQQQLVTHAVPALGVAPAATPVATPAHGDAAHSEASEDAAGTVTVKSPMVGTFYRSSKPESDRFVEIGDDVEEDTLVCIIEAMKVMNEIKADHKGRVVKILLENGEPVEYGQPLFLIATD